MDLATTTTDLTADEAKAITNRIRQHLQQALVYVKKAWDGRAWIALGYPNWDAYCEDSFGDRFRLGRDDRRELVVELHDAGMSTRAIASVTGASRTTVISDIRENQVVQSAPPAAATGPETFGELLALMADDEEADRNTPVAKVTGTDGKTYARPKQTAPTTHQRRPPINKSAMNLAGEVDRITRRLEKIRTDDRFRGSRDSHEFRRLAGMIELLVDEVCLWHTAANEASRGSS